MIINRAQILRTPGPTPVPDRIQNAMSQPMIGHRSSGFSQLFQEVAPRLKPIFGTTQDVYILTGSGTSALEAAVINTVSPGDEVLVLVTGNFGARFVDICEAYNLNVRRFDVEWGKACTPEQLKEQLKNYKNLKAVFMTHCETSTGVLNPIEELSKVIHEYTDALVIVDTVSSAAGVPVDMDRNGLDIVVSGSQKAFMLPPGLAFITLSPRAWEVVNNKTINGFYLNLKSYKNNYEKGMTPYTPALSLIYGLDEALKMLEEEGLENVYKRHQILMNMTRSTVRALGLPLLTTDKAASPTVTAISGTDSFNSELLRQTALNSFNLVFAGGQKQLKGKIFRIGHMGACTPVELLQTLTLLELSLYKMGYPVSLGTAAKEAEEVLRSEL